MAQKKNTLKYVLIGLGVLLVIAVAGNKLGFFGKGDVTEVAVDKAEARIITETVSASGKVQPEIEVKLHLVTSNNEDYIEGAKDAFEQMTYSLESIGIIFTYEFDENIHDRSINMDNGWKIVLGRGLDIWQKTGGWYDVNEYIQEKRLCKACEVTFVK
jgi:hypothetical protein